MQRFRVLSTILSAVLILACLAGVTVAQDAGIRVATYNASLYRSQPGQLVRDLEGGNNEQARRVAEVIQRVQPDVLLVNEFDFDPTGRAADLFRTQYLAVGQNGCEPIEYTHQFTAPVNTGRPSDRDLDDNGRQDDPADAIGFGRHDGQYGMLLLSKCPIDRSGVRTFREFLWRDMPGAMLPIEPSENVPFYDADDLNVLRLASKSFWDVPIAVPAIAGRRSFTLHVLCSHPTPPVFDGPEDRNGRRNHDEVRLVADYIDPNNGRYLVDDAGRKGGLPDGALFVIVGDLNADPVDGDSVPGTIDQLLKHPRVNNLFTPSSAGGKLATQQTASRIAAGKGDPAHDTSNFDDFQNLRIDYALPSHGLTVTGGGVFWPTPGEPSSDAITASDHRLVWIDIQVE
jgi:endonuclease/exonuclease/phosphatase family metal-dependent hydrolase